MKRPVSRIWTGWSPKRSLSAALSISRGGSSSYSATEIRKFFSPSHRIETEIASPVCQSAAFMSASAPAADVVAPAAHGQIQ